MSARSLAWSSLFALTLMAPATRADAPAGAREVEVRTTLDRTAVWVADRVTYTVTIVCNTGVDILAEDLSKDKLRVDGLEIVGSDSERAIGPGDKTVYTFRYTLTAYRVDLSDLKIAPMTVRYYLRRPGQRIGEAAPAGDVQVPAAVIAFRSALPDGQETYAVRDGREARARRLRYAWLQPIGTGLIVISIVPAVLAAMAMVRRARPIVKPRSPRQVRYDEQASLDALQALDISTPTGRRDAYSRLNGLVRDHLNAVIGVEASGLTPAEIDAAIAANGGFPIELATALLRACDHARYAQADALPSMDVCRQAIEQAAEVLGHK
jgi:hypothetical protein